MPRLIVLRLIVLLVGGLLPVLLGACAPDAPPPNLVVIHVDDLGWTDLGYAGSDLYRTPHIDGLAEAGMVFTNAYAAAAICSPSRAALMTGRYPARLGITDWIRASFQADAWQPGEPVDTYVADSTRRLATPRNRPYLPHEEITLAELFRDAGYTTMHIGKWHLGLEDWYPETQGFAFNQGGCDFGQPPSYFDPYRNDRVAGIPTLPPREPGEYLTDREADEAVGFIRAHRDRPFFLYLAPYAVHTPIQAPDSVAARYEGAIKTVHTNARYAAMIERLDAAVGAVLETLEDVGLRERTVVLFTSDNGGLEPVTDNVPLRDGKGSPYEGGLRVPLIVAWPGHIAPGRTDVPASSVDHLPTLAELAGVDVRHAVDGVSLAGVLQGEPPPQRPLFWHFPHYRTTQTGPYSVVRDGRWKLIRYDDPGPSGAAPLELYDLAADLGETINLAAEVPDTVRALEAELDSWIERVGARRPRPPS